MSTRSRRQVARERSRGLEGLIVCLGVVCPLDLAAGEPLSFIDATPAAGIETAGPAHGVAVGDYDGDGRDDVYVSVLGGVSSLFRNQRGGTFAEVARRAGVAVVGDHAAALWGDVDNDGHLDLFVGQRGGGSSHLFLNNGDGTFRDASASSGVDLAARVGTSAFGDFDGDGNLDLFLATREGPDLLYRNTASASSAIFADVSRQAGITGAAGSVAMQATWVDYDRDGDLDLFAVHDGRVRSRLYRNDGVLPMKDVAPAVSIASVGAGNSMGVAWGDVDGDGREDAYVTRIGTGGLYLSSPEGTFSDVAVESGASQNGLAWGAVFADLDHDGDQELFVANVHGFDGTPCLLFRNEGGSFTEIGARAGAALEISAHGVAGGDFNDDGHVDLFIATSDGRSRLLLNEGRSSGSWVKVRLEGRSVNRMAVGARVDIIAATRTYTRVLRAGDSYCSQSSATLHFGLGDARRIERLRIDWGRGRVEEKVDLAINKTYRFVEGERVVHGVSFVRGDCDGDARTAGISDAVFLLSFSLTSGAAPSCLAACDANLDGRVLGSVADAIYLLHFAFLGGAPPPPPFPRCGPGTADTDQELGCSRSRPACP